MSFVDRFKTLGMQKKKKTHKSHIAIPVCLYFFLFNKSRIIIDTVCFSLPFSQRDMS